MSSPLKAFRRLNTSVQSPRLTRFILHAPRSVEVEFNDGSLFNLSAEFLRIQSPAVDSKIRSVGGEKVIFGRRHVGIMSAEPVGNYGVSPTDNGAYVSIMSFKSEKKMQVPMNHLCSTGIIVKGFNAMKSGKKWFITS